jgi:Ca-activated chloride channel homolog
MVNQQVKKLASYLIKAGDVRRGCPLLLALVMAALASAHAQEPAPPQTPIFKSGVEIVTVTATVRDKKGRLVRGLTQKDFEIYDSGRRRPITSFRSDPSPVSLAILFDISGSMRLADVALAAKFAAYHVLTLLEPGRDEAALFTFDSRLHEVAPFTVDTRALQGALGEVDPFGATSLHDAIAEAAERAATRKGRRRAVVVITDGIDTASRLSPSQVSAAASAIDVPVYIVATVLPIDHPGRETSLVPEAGSPSAVATIEDLANWTGGALFYSSTPTDTSGVARLVVEELREQYVIAFEPAASAARWRPLEIRTRDRDLIVRTRSGYIAGDEASNNGR